MTIRMTNKARAAARSLAIAYDAFNDAKAAKSPSGLSVWGNRLIEVQEEIGIELFSARLIRDTIANHRAAA